MSDTFCVLPWKHLTVASGGETRLCCAYLPRLEQDGQPLTPRSHTLDEIWNSRAMRSIRQAMVEGTPVPGCEFCYREEAASGWSLRQLENSSWENGYQNEERVPIRSLREEAVAAGFRVDTAPRNLELDIGNLCNLMCRMCNASWSSRIAADPIHAKWTGEASPLGGDHAWIRQEGAIERLFQHPEQIRSLKLLGGETLLTRDVGLLLERLVAWGAAPAITLNIVTNATSVAAPWLELTGRFENVQFFVSIDGVGKHYEYIRYPARWETLLENVAVLRALPKAQVFAVVTLQIYNVLHAADLLRTLDSAGLPFFVNPLASPPYLAAGILPASVRRLAAARLHHYAGRDCRPEQRERVLALAAGLENGSGEPDVALLRQFMLFTNDLDRSRGQLLRQADAELVQLLAEAGIPWEPATLHA